MHRVPFESDCSPEDQQQIVAITGDQPVQRRDLQPRHRGERGDRLPVRLHHVEQPPLNDIERAGHQLLQMIVRQVRHDGHGDMIQI